MAKILYLIQKKIDKLDREKNHFDYFEKEHKIEFLNLSDFFKDFFDLSFLTLLKNWKQILKIIKRINLYRPNYIFVKVATTNLKAEIIKWLVLTFTKKSKIIISKNNLPDLNLSKKNIFKEFNPRITNLLGKFFLKVNSNKIIFLKTKKGKRGGNIMDIIIPARDADKFIEEKKYLKKSSNKIIFLDEMFADHPDFKIIKYDNKILNYVSKNENVINYYEEINEMLYKIYKIKKLPICICLHPKHSFKDGSNKFKFSISGKHTINEVAKANIVIAHSSTSINFAVLLNKPLLLYKSIAHQYSFYHEKLIDAFSRELDVNVFDLKTIESLPLKNIKVNKKKYRDYIRNYLLPKGINKTSYEIINKYFNKNDINN